MKKKFEQSAELTSPLRGEVGAPRRVREANPATRSIAKARTLRRNQTETERIFWNLIRNRQLGRFKFVRQYPVGPYVADFACRSEMLIVELDGGQHSGPETDRIRTKFLNDKGYSILRFWNNEVEQNKEGCCTALLITLQAAPSPSLRFAPATLSPKGRGKERDTQINGR